MFHLPENPADHASRGLSPEQLLATDIWWNGPPWLKDMPDQWPAASPSIQEPPETRKNILIATTSTQETNYPLWEHYSSFTRLIRIITWCRRFIRRSRQRRDKRPPETTQLTPEEISSAKNNLFKTSQRQSFDFITALYKGKPLTRSYLTKYCPLLDNEGILRVGGRLERAEVTYTIKHPIILHAASPLVKLYRQHLHQTSGHPGPAAMEAILSDDFLIIGLRRLLKSYQSLLCHLQKGLPEDPTSDDGPPTYRPHSSRATFHHSGCGLRRPIDHHQRQPA